MRTSSRATFIVHLRRFVNIAAARRSDRAAMRGVTIVTKEERPMAKGQNQRKETKKPKKDKK